MSSPYPPPSGIGNIASAITEFANGFRQAKSQKQQREDKERENLHRQADDMLKWASVLPQTEHAKLLENYARLKDMADAPTPKTKQKPGIGNLILRMFGGGQETIPNTETGPNTQMIQGVKDRYQQQQEADSLRGPEPEPGRGDYGSSGMANFLGPAAEERPAMPPVPRESQGSVADQSIHRAMPMSPVQQFAQPGHGQPQGAAPSPVQSSAAQAYQQRQISPDQLVRQVTAQHSNWAGSDTAAISTEVRQKATDIVSGLLDKVHSFIDVTPGHETFEQAYANPQIRQALDGIKNYAHLTGQKFEDIVAGHFALKPEETKYEQRQGDYGNGQHYNYNYNPATGQATMPNGAVIPNPRPVMPAGTTPSAIAEYNFYSQQETGAGRKPLSFNEWSLKQHPGSVPSSVGEYNFYAGQEQAAGRKPLTFDAWQTRDANRKSGKEAFDALEKYRVNQGSTSSITKDGGIQQSSGGATYDVGGLIDAINNSARTGMTLDRVQSALSAYEQADPQSADAVALRRVVAAFNRKAAPAF